jgi:hypothetical protein
LPQVFGQENALSSIRVLGWLHNPERLLLVFKVGSHSLGLKLVHGANVQRKRNRVGKIFVSSTVVVTKRVVESLFG